MFEKKTMSAKFTSSDVARHASRDDCWIIFEQQVFDVTSFIAEHPGGDAILQAAGRDATEMFRDVGHSEGICFFFERKNESNR